MANYEELEEESEDSISNSLGISDLELSNLRDILSNNTFDDQIKQVVTELANLENLYRRTSEHTNRLMDEMEGKSSSDKPRRMNTEGAKRVSPMYISSQTTNLISMANAKFSMLKHLSDLQRDKLDRAFKVVNQFAKDKEKNKTAIGVSPTEILNLLMNFNVQVPVIPKTKADVQGRLLDHEDNIDSMLMERMDNEGITKIPTRFNDEGAIEESIEEETENTSEEATKIYFDQSSETYYLIDNEYNAIRELDENELDIVETNDGYFCNNFQLDIEVSEE